MSKKPVGFSKALPKALDDGLCPISGLGFAVIAQAVSDYQSKDFLSAASAFIWFMSKDFAPYEILLPSDIWQLLEKQE